MAIPLLIIPAAVAVTSGAIVVYKKFLRPRMETKEKEYEDKFANEAWSVVQSYLAEKEGLDKVILDAEIERVRKGGTAVEGGFRKIQQIDCDYVKTGPSQVTRTFSIAYRNDDEICLVKFEQSLEWDDLPSALRKEFITKGNQPQSYRMYPNGGEKPL